MTTETYIINMRDERGEIIETHTHRSLEAAITHKEEIEQLPHRYDDVSAELITKK